MFKAESVKALFLLRIITLFPLLSSWGVRPTLSSGAVKQPSEMPDRFTLLLVTLTFT